MGKMKTATCPACGKTIARHDPNRMKVTVARSTLRKMVEAPGGVNHMTYNGIHKDYHLACAQAMEE